jgi:LuxR family transcriptional regulator, maltose regulon positive regulatory protein
MNRSRPPQRIARPCAAGNTLQIGPGDLPRVADETPSPMRAAEGAPGREGAEAACQPTEDWPVGLYLAALCLRQGGSLGGAVVSSGKNDQLAGKSLESEFLGRVSWPDRMFLTRTAVLEGMCGPLCEAVLELPGSAATLAALARSDLLLVPLDRQGQWYRYHHAFRDMLLAELEHQTPDLIPGLRRRAADWCLRNDLPEEALEYSIAAGDVEMAARLVEQLWVPVCLQGRYAALQWWIQWLDDRGGVEGHPMVALAASVVSAATGRPAEAERWAEWVDRRAGQGAPRPYDSPSRAFPAVLRALLCRRGVEQMLADADEAARRFAAQGILIPVIALLQGIALVLSGDLDGGDAYLEAATSAGEQAAGTDVLAIALAERSLVAMAGGNWHRADGLAGQALAVLRRGRTRDSCATPLVCAVQARAFLHQGDIAAARQDLVSAQRKRPVLTYALPYLAVQARIELARVHFALADLAGARTLMREVDDLLKRRPSLGTLVGEAGTFQAQLASERGSIVSGASALTAAELRLLPLLSTYLSLHEIAAELFLSPHTVRTQAKSIYRKLGASSRSQAVTLAGELELLEGLGTGSLSPCSVDEARPGRPCNSARRRAETLWARAALEDPDGH